MFFSSGNHGDGEGEPLCSSNQIECGSREKRDAGGPGAMSLTRAVLRGLVPRHPHRRGPVERRRPLLSRTRTAFLLAPRPEPLARSPPRGDAREQLSKKGTNKRDAERGSARVADDSRGSRLSPGAPSPRKRHIHNAHTCASSQHNCLHPAPCTY